MRITFLFVFILIFTDESWSEGALNAGCQEGGSDCGNEESESLLSSKSYGVQEVDHDGSIEAIVMRPPSQGRNNALAHFRKQWENKEVEESDQTEKDESDQEVPDESQDGDESDNYDSGGPNSDGLVPINQEDPEEMAKYKQVKDVQTFSRILSINEGANVTGVFEGDMRFTRNRNAAGDSAIWPKSKFGGMKGLVPIPYKISTKYNKTEVDIIKSAMALYTKHTCIRFVPRKTEIAYIYITDAKGCWAYVGKTGYSAQTVSLGRPGCVVKGIAAHEMMHVVGFQHEHSRSDRDKYVTILEHNIQKDMKPNFKVHNDTKNLVIYDYNSVMHYSKNAFSKFQYLPAIQINPKRKPEPDIGQRERMSPYDIEEIKYLYNCAVGTYQRCGRDFINSRGDSFASPRYPNPYPPEAHCTWKITVPRGRFVSLTITDLDVKESKFCQKDAILIHDGVDASSSQLEVLCGKRKGTTTIVSTGNSLFVMFTSDPTDKVTSTGFKATFKISHSPGSRPKVATVPTLPPIVNSQTTFDCDFDSGTCGMTQDTLDEIDWIRYKGATPSQGTGPSSDHTSGNGYYMYVESSLPSKLGDNAILRTPWMTKSRVFCISFSYHMLGAYTGTLRLYAFEKRKTDRYGHEVLLWERHGNQGNRWVSESVTHRPKANVEHVQYFWEAFVFFYLSDFGLDDVSVKNQNCQSSSSGGASTTQRVVLISPTKPTTTTTKKSFARQTTTSITATTSKAVAITRPNVVTSPLSATSCNFESDFCGWTQGKTDDFDWIRSNQETPSHNTGPRTDHTTSTGYFLFIEASNPRIEGDVARLLSPRLTAKPHCLQMWYHMYGTQMGTLMIKQITNGVETKLIEKSGDKGNQWHYVELDIITPSVKTLAKLTTESYTQIAIDAKRGAGYPGDMAIDDIVVTSSACLSASTASTTAAPRLRSVQCGFDTKKDLCGFTNTLSDNFDWTQNTGNTQSGSTGPTMDHTKGNSSGYYMYIEASAPRAKGDNATLVSPKLASGKYCVSFFAHMWGSGMGEVQVYTSEFLNSKSESRQNRWEMSGTQGDTWFRGEFEFETAVNIDYVQVEFVGIVGHTFTSDAALDDISISPGFCRKKGNSKPPAVVSATSGPLTKTVKPSTARPTIVRTTTAKSGTTRSTTTKQTTKPRTTTATTTAKVTMKSTMKTKPRTSMATTRAPAIKRTTVTPTTRRAKTRRPTRRITTARPTRSKTKPTVTTARQTRTTKRTTPKPTSPTTKKSVATVTARGSTTRGSTSHGVRPTAYRSTRRATTGRPDLTTKHNVAKLRTRPTTTPRPTTVRTRPTKPTTSMSKPARARGTKGTQAPVTKAMIVTSRNIVKKTEVRENAVKAKQATGDPRATEFSCDFESEIYCRMSQLSEDKFDWIRHSGNTPSSGTGPLNDHTYSSQKGHYLYIEGSDPRVRNDNAIIATPALTAKPIERCVTFWYHMYGNGIGSIRIYSELSRNGVYKKFSLKSNKRLVHSVIGHKGKEWRKAQMSVKVNSANPSATVRFHFEGVRGGAYRSDAAIDDICITSAPCNVRSHCTPLPQDVTTAATVSKKIVSTRPPVLGRSRTTANAKRKTPATTKVTTTRSTTTPTDNTKALADLTVVNGLPVIMPLCTFDVAKSVKKSFQDQISAGDPRPSSNVMCGWEQGKRDDFDWRWKSGKTLSSYTGPNGDHTSGKGHYLFIESSAPRKTNDVAILQSKKMYPTSYCFDLFYHMYGRGIGQLLVRVNQEIPYKPRVLNNLKIIRGQQGQAWGRIKVNFRPRGNITSVRFQIEGVIGKDYMGDIAVDDVQVTPGRCGACLRPNKKFKDRFGQVKAFSTGCVHGTLFYVRCCSLSEEKIVFQEVPKCYPNVMNVERLNWMCYYQ